MYVNEAFGNVVGTSVFQADISEYMYLQDIKGAKGSHYDTGTAVRV